MVEIHNNICTLRPLTASTPTRPSPRAKASFSSICSGSTGPWGVDPSASCSAKYPYSVTDGPGQWQLMQLALPFHGWHLKLKHSCMPMHTITRAVTCCQLQGVMSHSCGSYVLRLHQDSARLCTTCTSHTSSQLCTIPHCLSHSAL